MASSGGAAAVLSNATLASAIHDSVAHGLATPFVRLGDVHSPQGAFEGALALVADELDDHPRRALIRRLIEHGPLDMDAEPQYGTATTRLTDEELGRCIDFIEGRMINAFQGAVGELLALAPCSELVETLRDRGDLNGGTVLHWGTTIRQRQARRMRGGLEERQWTGYAWGADGLLSRTADVSGSTGETGLIVDGIVEVKSGEASPAEIDDQIESHLARMEGGLELEGAIWSGNQIRLAAKLVRIAVRSSRWRVSRHRREPGLRAQPLRRAIFRPNRAPEVFDIGQAVPPTVHPEIRERRARHWLIELNWSVQALREAAFEMSLWYMGRIGARMLADRPATPRSNLTAEERGINRVKEALRSATLRPLTQKQDAKTVFLYNAYCYGFAAAAEADEMLFLPGEGGTHAVPR